MGPADDPSGVPVSVVVVVALVVAAVGGGVAWTVLVDTDETGGHRPAAATVQADRDAGEVRVTWTANRQAERLLVNATAATGRLELASAGPRGATTVGENVTVTADGVLLEQVGQRAVFVPAGTGRVADVRVRAWAVDGDQRVLVLEATVWDDEG